MPHAPFPRAAARRVPAAPRRRPPHPRRDPTRPEPVTALEPRRLLAAFFATSADDVIHVFGRPGDMHVVVNGVDHATADNAVDVYAGAGEDRVYLGAIAQAGTLVTLTLRLGDGNDRVTNFNPDTNTGNLDSLRPNLRVHGDGGTDSIGLDDSDNPRTASGRIYTFGESGNAVPTPGTMTYTQNGTNPINVDHYTVEEFLLDAGNGPDSVYLYTKYLSMTLAVTTGGGDDNVTAGGDEFDARGWASGTTSLSAGAGDDAVLFNDRRDATSTRETSAAITLAGFTISKGSTGFTYSGFERVSHFAAQFDVVNVIGPSSSVYRLDVYASFLNTVTLLTVPATTNVHLLHYTTVNVGNGNLSALGGAVTLVPEPGVQAATLNINDQGATAGHTHTLTAAGYTRAALGGAPAVAVNYTAGLERINLIAGPGADWMTVESSPPGTATTVRGNDGNDSLYVARGNLAALGGPVSTDGGPGADDVRFDNSASPGHTDAVLTANAFTANAGPTHPYAGAESVSLLLSEGGSRTEARSLSAARLSVTGGQGDDVLVVGAGDLDSNFPGSPSVFFDGYPGTDRLEYDDRLDTNNPLLDPDVYTLDAQLYPLFGGVFLRYDRLRKGPAAAPTVESWRVEQRVLLASGAGTAINVLDAGTGLRVEANGGDDAVTVHDTPAGQPVVVHTGEGSDSLDINTDAAAADLLPAVVLLARTDAVASLHVRPGGTLRVGPGAVLTKAPAPAGSFSLLGVIDLAGGAMVVKDAPALFTYLRDALRGGYNAGAWNGTSSPRPDGTAGGAIHSSLAAASPALDAVGLAPAAALYRRPSLFMGHVVSPGDLLLRRALAGDANLDTRVDARDMAHARAGSGRPSARWDQGDFNFDTRSDARDYLLLRRNHGRLLVLPPAAGA